DPGIVDHAVDAAALRDDGLHRLADAVGAGDVERQHAELCVALARLRDQVLCLPGVSRRAVDPEAALREMERHLASEPGRRASNQDTLVHRSVLSLYSTYPSARSRSRISASAAASTATSATAAIATAASLRRGGLTASASGCNASVGS